MNISFLSQKKPPGRFEVTLANWLATLTGIFVLLAFLMGPANEAEDREDYLVVHFEPYAAAPVERVRILEGLQEAGEHGDFVVVDSEWYDNVCEHDVIAFRAERSHDQLCLTLFHRVCKLTQSAEGYEGTPRIVWEESAPLDEERLRDSSAREAVYLVERGVAARWRSDETRE